MHILGGPGPSPLGSGDDGSTNAGYTYFRIALKFRIVCGESSIHRVFFVFAA
jgi:hypothetical protein